MFSWLPVESMIHDRQDEYYQAINRSNTKRNPPSLSNYSLCPHEEALLEAVQTGRAENRSTEEQRWHQIKYFLEKNG